MVSYNNPEIGRVIEVVQEWEKSARVKTRIAYTAFLGRGQVELRECDFFVRVPKSAVDDDGYIDEGILWKNFEPKAFAELNEYKAKKEAEAAHAAETEPATA
jgi:hypothetical protein